MLVFFLYVFNQVYYDFLYVIICMFDIVLYVCANFRIHTSISVYTNLKQEKISKNEKI